jgi:hypothetical protein
MFIAVCSDELKEQNLAVEKHEAKSRELRQLLEASKQKVKVMYNFSVLLLHFLFFYFIISLFFLCVPGQTSEIPSPNHPYSIHHATILH